MKKIQVSTIQMQCNAEAVILNSYVVSKAAKAMVALNMFKHISEIIRLEDREAVDDEGEPVAYCTIHKDQLDLLNGYVFPFVEEFAKAFEDQEESEHN